MRALLAFPLAFALMLAGCAAEEGAPTTASPTASSSPSASGTPTPVATPASPTPAPTATPPSDPHVATVDILVENFRFSPATTTAGPGEVIQWRNLDAASHTATADDGTFDVALDGGSEGLFSSLVNGTWPYHCKLHPSMRATLVVGDGQMPAPPATPDVPAPTPESPAPTPTPAPATPSPAATPAPATPTPSAPTPVAIAISQFAFSPASTSVPVGTTVTWTNSDSAPHTATADSNAFTTSTLQQGQSGSVTMSTPGTFPYHCAVHPSMTGTITVTA